MIIRPIETQDDEVWLHLRHALWPDYTLAELRTHLEPMRTDAGCEVFLAFTQDAGEQAVGFIELSTRSHAPGSPDAPVPYIEGWYVAPDYQRRGVGAALVRAAEEWAIARGFKRMASDTLPRIYTASPAAHVALGYQIVAVYPAGVIDEDEESMHFIRQLTESDQL